MLVLILLTYSASKNLQLQMQVRKRPLNKKEIAKKEEDIITIDRNANSLTVYETKLKVSLLASLYQCYSIAHIYLFRC